ncbi:hypothetical protein C6A85_14535, partial [Mycobacterium sp. ITM-2017-0098]
GDATKTISVASTSKTPTGDMVYDKTISYPETPYLLHRLGQVSPNNIRAAASASKECTQCDT